MRHGSLFSGIGGFDLAAELMGWQNIFSCEINSFGQKVLKYYWPNTTHYEDITKTDFTIHRGTIDVLTGGFPCQPYSAAGKRKGKEDERHLWPQMLRAIREIRPTWVVGENVFGIVSWNGGLVFNEVQADLEAEGYEVQPYVLPAVAVNAPHRRDRVWFVAHRDIRDGETHGLQTGREVYMDRDEGSGSPADALNGRHRDRDGESGEEDRVSEINRQALRSRMSDGAGDGSSTDTKGGRSKRKLLKRQEEGELRGCDSFQATTDTNRGRQSCEEYGEEKAARLAEIGIRRDWENFPTQPPICGRDDGISTKLSGITFSKHRNESIKAYGNAIVPQVALQIFKTIEAYEAINKNK